MSNKTRGAGRRRRGVAPSVLGSLLVGTLLIGCSSSSGEPSPEPEPGDSEALYAGGTFGTVFATGADAFEQPMPGLDRDGERLFFKGKALFRDFWTAPTGMDDSRDGLGPIFNATSCHDCHERDGRGVTPPPGEDLGSLLVRVSVPGEGEHGGPLPEATYGGQIQPFSIEGAEGEGAARLDYETVTGSYDDGEPFELRRPVLALELALGPMADDAMTSVRVTQQLVGLGLLEAIPEATIAGLEGEGIIQQVYDRAAGEMTMGRFGWKATQPTVMQQAAGAFAGDMGLTSELFSTEDCASTVAGCPDLPSGGEPEVLPTLLENVGFYAGALAVPARRDIDDPEVQRGEALFAEAGCDTCHTPRHVLGEHPLIPGLEGQVIWPYTDLRVHDMGEELADQRPVYQADGRSWRTPPLWGLGLVATVNGELCMMHDGRALSFPEAILWHGGQAEESREAFVAMASEDRHALVRFLESL